MKSKVVEITEQNVGVNVGDNVGETVGESSRVKLSKNQNLILQLLLEDKELSIEKMAESVGITTRSVERNISILKDKGFLERVGSDRAGYWKVTSEGAQILRGIK